MFVSTFVGRMRAEIRCEKCATSVTRAVELEKTALAGPAREAHGQRLGRALQNL